MLLERNVDVGYARCEETETGDRTSGAHSDVLLTVIVPAYNEASTIGELLRRVRDVPEVNQIIVVDDGSTDGTDLELESIKDRLKIEVLRHAKNSGKGAAIRTGLRHATGRFTLIQDADLEYDPSEYARLLEPVLSGQAEVVYGSRYLNHTTNRGRWLFDHGVGLLNLVVWALYRIRVSDEATCYKLFSTQVLRQMELECNRFEFCPEVTAKVARMGLQLKEVPISYHPRSATEGKKIKLRDGVAAIQTLWKWRNWRKKAFPHTVRRESGSAEALHFTMYVGMLDPCSMNGTAA